MFPLLNSSKYLFTSNELNFRNKNYEYYLSLLYYYEYCVPRTPLVKDCEERGEPTRIYHRIIYLSVMY